MSNQISETHKRAKEDIILIAKTLYTEAKISERSYTEIIERLRVIQDEPYLMIVDLGMGGKEITIETEGKAYRLKATSELVGDLPKIKKAP